MVIQLNIEGQAFVNQERDSKSFIGRIKGAFHEFWRNRAIKRVQDDGYKLKQVSRRFQDDECVVRAAIRQTGGALSCASDRLKANKPIVLEAIAMWGWGSINGFHFRDPFTSASPELKDDMDVVEAAFQKDRLSLQKASKRCVLEKVKQDGMNLYYVSKEHSNDPDIVRAAVEQNKNAIRHAGKEYLIEFIHQGGELNFFDIAFHLREDPDIILAFLEKTPYITIPEDLLNTREFALRAVQKNGCVLQYFPLFQNDGQIVDAAFQNDPRALQYASRTLVLAKVEQDGLALKHASDSHRADREIFSAACQQNPAALQFGTKELVLETVRQNGLVLEHASIHYQHDPEICEAAFQNTPLALQFASYDFVLAKVQQQGLNLQYASESHRGYHQIVNAACLNNPSALQYANGWAARGRVMENGLALQHASAAQQNDRDFVRSAVNQNGMALQYASEALRADRDIVREAIRQNADALQFASEAIRNDPTIHNAFDFVFLEERRKFTVKLEDIDDNPQQVLIALYPNMENGFPRIEYQGSPGVDAGGLSRDFVARMMKAVFDKKPLPMRELDGKFIPKIEDGKPEQVAGYQAVGAIMASALEKRQQIVTGNYCHALFFEMVHSLTNDEIAAFPDMNQFADIPEAAVHKLFRIYARNQLRLTDGQVDNILLGNVPEEIQVLTSYETKDDFFTENFKQMALGCAVISKSMRAHLRVPDNWDHIKGAAGEFAMKIEGSLTLEGVLGALEWNQDHEATKGYLIQWLNACSEEELEKFVWAISGSKTLAPGQKLKIELYFHAEKLPTYHTCFFKMDLPNGYPSYEVFKEKLDLSLASVNGMQMA